MLQLIIGTIVCACFCGIIKIKEIEDERAWTECENTDWNEYYANI